MPKFIGWFTLGSCIFLISVGNLVLVADQTLPVRVQQIIFAVAVGVFIRKICKKNIADLLKSKTIILLLFFFTLEMIAGLRHPDATLYKFIMLHQYPSYLAVLLLSFSLINNRDDYDFFWYLFLFNIGLMSAAILIELSYGYNLSFHACALNFSTCRVQELHWAPSAIDQAYYEWSSPSSFFIRYSGFTGEPNKTAILLAMGIIPIFYKYISVKESESGSRALLLVTVTTALIVSSQILLLLISQVRAAIGAVVLVLVVISIYERRLVKLLLLIIAIEIGFFLINTSARDYLFGFAVERLAYQEIFVPAERTIAARSAWQYFLDSPLLGYGGTIYSISERLLNHLDLSAFVLYFLSGGVFLGTAYIVIMLLFIVDLIKKLPDNNLSDHRSKILLTIGAIAFLIITQFFNENAVLFFIILLYSTAKASLRNRLVS